MITIYQFLWILFGHWIADFVCQTHWQATNKSKNNWALIEHVFVYSGIMMLFAAWILYDARIFYFTIITFTTHFCTDYITSRMTSKMWVKGQYHNFFVIIGMDQFIHFATLALTLIWLTA